MKNTIKNLNGRQYVLGTIVSIVVLIFIIQLFRLQILNHEYKNSADNNAFFHRTLYPARGTISDRNKKLLVYNQPTYDVVFIAREVQAFDTLDFCKTLGITKQWFHKRFAEIKDKERNPGYSSYTMQTFMTQLGPRESSLLQEKLYKFPGFFIQNRTLRQYNNPNAGLLLGYVAEVSKTQMERDEYYARGDYGGKSGIELFYEKELRGEKGHEVILRDAKGRLQGRYEDGQFDKAPVSGKNITLSLDMDLQAYGEYLLQNKIGSIVMIEPATGEVLAMATSPSYDPALLLGRNFSSNYFALEKNPIKPLFNRAIQGTYPPGSVFKPTQGAIFLEEGAITTTTAFPCHGGYAPLGNKPKCHPHSSPVAIVGALGTSCNAFFCYGLTAMLHNKKYGDVNKAFDVWKDHMVDMGFGHKIGIDLPHENQGFIPNSQFYSKHHTTNWKAANVISIAIGQGEILSTPLQLANFASVVANRGYYYAPHIVKDVEDIPLQEKYATKHVVGIKQEHWETIAEGMAFAVTNGTCRRTNLLPEIQVAGKTGTAQNPHGRDHSIFIGFAPLDNPKVAIAVVVENAGFGATYGVPIARLMLQKYLKGAVPASDKYIEDHISSSVILPAEFTRWKHEQTMIERESARVNITTDR